MRDFRKGDVVRVGKGKVLYTVWANQLTRKIYLESHNTGRVTTADTDRVVLVTPAADVAGPVLARNDTVPEHIPGESPAQYQARTGLKLDGRTTSYGRAILAALQLKPVFPGLSRSRSDQTPGPTRQARNASKKVLGT